MTQKGAVCQDGFPAQEAIGLGRRVRTTHGHKENLQADPEAPGCQDRPYARIREFLTEARSAMALSCNHRSKQELLALRGDMERMLPLQKAAVVTYSIASGIIRPGMALGVMFKAFGLRFGKEGPGRFASLLCSKPAALDSMWKSTMGHMVDGKDTFDAMSAGGFNKQELDGLLGFLGSMGWTRPLPPPVTPDAKPETVTPGL